MDKKVNAEKKFIEIKILLIAFVILAVLTVIMWHSSSKNDAVDIPEGNSTLAEYVCLSPNATSPRENKITKITIHHMAANLSLTEVGSLFSQTERKASSNYAIDSSGRIGLYVSEKDRAWSSSNSENDSQAVTIEVANDETGGMWHVSDAAYNSLIDLCVDICRRNDIKELNFTGDADGNLTIHKMFDSNTQCPGPYLESRMKDIADEVNRQLRR